MSKPKVAFFDFASCEGCQLAILNCEEILLDILNLVEIVEFREAISDKAEKYDVAFIEGSINRPKDEARLRDIRNRSAYIVALGSCACHGNVQARSNFVSPMNNFKEVYGEVAIAMAKGNEKYNKLWNHTGVKEVSKVVNVDFYLRGCPVVPSEFLELVKALLQGKSPNFPEDPVCTDCKRNENECVFDRKLTCMGPITYGGCDSVCINGGWVCDGCRGILPGANINAHVEVMKERGIDTGRIMNKYKLHCSNEEIARGGAE